MRVLIVGAAGSVGRQLVPHLAERGHEVICFDLQRPVGEPYERYHRASTTQPGISTTI